MEIIKSVNTISYKNGIKEKDRKNIAKNYLKEKALIDVICILSMIIYPFIPY